MHHSSHPWLSSELCLDLLIALFQLIFKCHLDHILHVVQFAFKAFEFLIAVLNRLLTGISFILLT